MVQYILVHNTVSMGISGNKYGNQRIREKGTKIKGAMLGWPPNRSFLLYRFIRFREKRGRIGKVLQILLKGEEAALDMAPVCALGLLLA